MNKLFKIHMFF